jgi:hypothetical protein
MEKSPIIFIPPLYLLILKLHSSLMLINNLYYSILPIKYTSNLIINLLCKYIKKYLENINYIILNHIPIIS